MSDLVIRWAPIPGTAQEQFFDDDTPDAALLFAGGYGSGKTMTLWGKVLKLSALNNPLPVLWVVPNYDHIHKAILPKLEAMDDEIEPPQPWFFDRSVWAYNHQQHEWRWKGGGPVWFKSAADAEDVARIAGPEVAAAFVDEPALISLSAWRRTVARVRHVNAKLRQTCAAGTAESLDWLDDYFFDPDRPERYHRYDMSTEDNVELIKRNPEYLDTIREQATEAEIAAFIHGRGVRVDGQPAYPQFSDTLHWQEAVPLERNLPLVLTCDFNVSPMDWVLGQQVMGPHGPEARVVDALTQQVATIDTMCEAILDRYPSWPPGLHVYGDATGHARHVRSHRSNYDLIRERLAPIGPVTVRVPTVNPPVADRINAVNRLLLTSKGITRLWIRKWAPARTCPTRSVVRSLQRTMRKTGTADVEKRAGETITHAGDALGYWIAAEFPAAGRIIVANLPGLRL